jgi:hypothetical protein
MNQPTVEADAAVVRHIGEHGGRLFVWLSAAGIEHETWKPKSGIDFSDFHADGFKLLVDRAIETPDRWTLVFHRFPKPHVRALWNGGAFSPSAARAPRWEGGSPFGSQSSRRENC